MTDPTATRTGLLADLDDGDVVRLGVLAICVPQLVFAIAGLLVHPDFATGSELSSKALAGVDFNGWHALSGLLVYLPGLLAATRATWSRWYCWSASVTLVVTGLWPLWDRTPFGLLDFPNPLNDTVFHFLSATAFLGLLALTRKPARA